MDYFMLKEPAKEDILFSTLCAAHAKAHAKACANVHDGAVYEEMKRTPNNIVVTARRCSKRL